MVNLRRGIRERRCPFCTTNFTKEEHLARHIRTHTKERPFGCATCGKMFTRHDTLLRHSRSHQLQGDETEPSPSNSPSRLQQQRGASRRESTRVPEEAVSALLDMGRHQQSPNQPELQQHTRQQSFNVVGVVSPESVPASGDASPNTIFTSSGQGVWYTSASTVSTSDADMQSSFLAPDSLSIPAKNRPSRDIELWSALSSQTPGWLAGDDFDLAAFNSITMPSVLEWPPVLHNGPEPSLPNYGGPIPDFLVVHNQEPEPREEIVRRHWFTYISENRSGHITPAEVLSEAERAEVDERYRENLSQQLQPRISSDPLPSTDILNLCLEMYFTRFDAILPVVHAATFRPSKRQSLLLLSMCSIGSLFLGSPHGTSQGMRLFEQLNKAILASWESHMMLGSGETLAMTQAALIGQTFAMLSGNPRHLAIAQTFHGTVIAWARQHKMFDQGIVRKKIADILDKDVNRAWKLWASSEEKLRVSIGLRIHDTELAELVRVEPFLRSSQSAAQVANCELWTAATAERWAVLFKQQTSSTLTTSTPAGSSQADLSSGNGPICRESRKANPLIAYATLEETAAAIMENRSSNTLAASSQKIQDSLLQLFTEHLQQRNADTLCLQALWHSTFVSLFCDINVLELAIGKEGHSQAQQHHESAKDWATSENSHRCALHAALVLRNLENIPIGTEPAIHVPRILYHAALVWYAYTKFGRDDDNAGSSQPLDFPELDMLGINSRRLLFEINGFKRIRPGPGESSTLCCLVDMLQRVSHWDISRKMAALMTVLIYGSIDEQKKSVQ